MTESMLKRLANRILEQSRNVGLKLTDIDAMHIARLAVGEMRTPTPEMLKAVPPTYRTADGLGFVGGDALGTWQRMIDATLADQS